jgi:hypothetical protein
MGRSVCRLAASLEVPNSRIIAIDDGVMFTGCAVVWGTLVIWGREHRVCVAAAAGEPHTRIIGIEKQSSSDPRRAASAPNFASIVVDPLPPVTMGQGATLSADEG